MEYMLRCVISGFVFILCGFMFGAVYWSYRERKFREKLNRDEIPLTDPESYIWVNANDYLPIHNREYLVEYCFEACPDVRFHSVHDFNIRENRFQHEGFHGLKVVRWAELPR